MKYIAVIDVGKTNAKLAVVDVDTLTEVAVKTRPNRVISAGPWPHYDLDGHWVFFKSALRDVNARFPIDAISVTTHGAALTVLDTNGRAFPMMDYEFSDLDGDAGYDALRPDFVQTGSPRSAMGLNAGKQLYWMMTRGGINREQIGAIVTYPQYWGYLLTGQRACDVTSLGCHTDLWAPQRGDFSDLVDRLDVADKFAPPRKPSEVLGHVLPDIAGETGLARGTPVMVGIHDSNASLYPYLTTETAPFSVVSTGTWVIAMAMGGAAVKLDLTRETLLNVSALGEPVPTARFMGGREFETLIGADIVAPTQPDRDAVLEGISLLPAVEPNTGPFVGRPMEWRGTPQTQGQKVVAVSFYLALMTQTCLGLIGAGGRVIVEGPFAKNIDFLAMLSAVYPDGVAVAGSATGTSIGAAMLALPKAQGPDLTKITPPKDTRFNRYAQHWNDAI